jgi:carboxymethylenebutenolidase
VKAALAVFVLVLLAAVSGGAARGATADAPTGEMVQFPAGGKDTAAGFLALPDKTGRHPAVLVIHPWWGLNGWVKQQTDKLAAQGFISLAVDLYGGHVASDASEASQLRMGLKDEDALRDVTAAFYYLAARNDVDRDHIGAVGWDMGGGFALKLAVNQPHLAACVVNYGVPPTDPNDIQQIFAPVLGNFGALDRGILPSDVQYFENALKNLKRRVDIKVYDDAGHGFANPENKDTYQPTDAADAWSRTIAFLNQTLK